MLTNLLIFAAILFCHPQSAQLKSSPWYKRALVGMEVGPTGAQFGSDPSDVGYAARFDGHEIVRRCKAAGCDYMVIWARDGEYAYYDSKLQPKAPGLGKRDVLREAVDEGAKQRLPIIAYCVLQTPTQALRAHPEWAMRNSAGKAIAGRVCFNSPYREYAKGLLKEMLGYGIAGFHLDMVDQGFGPPYGCWCDTCKELFQREYGRPMPAGVTWDADWDRMLTFRYDTSERFEKDLRQYVRTVRAGASVDFNYHGNPPFSWEVGQRPVQHAGNGDFVTGETGVWGFSALTVGLNAEFYRAAVANQRVQVAMQRGVRMYHDQTTRPLTDIRWELLTLLTHGAFVTMVDKTGYDGWLDPVAYARIGHAFADAKRRSPHFGQKPVAEVGIWFSSRTRDWYGREKPADYFQSFLGAHKALVYSHIPYRVVLDENASPDSLRSLPALLVPNSVIITARDADTFRAYVRGGGNLIFTGSAGCRDLMGRSRQSSSVEDLIGARFIRQLDSLDNHVRLPHGGSPGRIGLLRALPGGWPFLVKGPAAVWDPITAAPVGELLQPHRTVRQKQGNEGADWPMSADRPVGPAILMNRFGKGTVLTFACSPDWAAASDHHITEDRLLLANAIRTLVPVPRVRISAPVTVESVVTDDPANRTLRVHLLVYNAPPQTMPAKDRPYVLPALMEDPPIFAASIECRDSIRSVRKRNASTKLKRAGRRIDVLVRDTHEVIVIRY